MVDIVVPPLGESVTEATVAKWLVNEGDSVAADQALCELETDKVTLEVNAPSAGILKAIKAKQGVTVSVGAIIGSVEAGGKGAAAPAKKEEPKVSTTAPSVPKAGPEPVKPKAEAANTSTAHAELSPAVQIGRAHV